MSKESIDPLQSNPKHQKGTTLERRNAMEECLKVAAQIRQELTGRSHSNSTELAAEDRQR